jgi:5-methylcytosine-specific restriction endonuclease McrA
VDSSGKGGLLEQKVSVPKPEFQLSFLTKLQRLFAEGDFTATYKFALLIAICDIAVQSGNDSNEPLVIQHRSLGSKFIELYWQQAAPFNDGVLVQNLGTQATVVSKIARFRLTNGSLNEALCSSTLLTAVTATVVAQPVKYLQNLSGTTDEFLFERRNGQIVLLPGVAYCLRRFQPLVNQLARSQWVNHIKNNRQNAVLVGENNDLEAFLFQTSRRSLEQVAAGLRKISSKCFYCGSKLTDADVDHFLPHSMYPRDLTHNFVLADPSCNRSKSDALAAKNHLFRWLDFIDRHDDKLTEIGMNAGVPVNKNGSLSIARWGYSSGVVSGAYAWVRSKVFEKIKVDYLENWDST